MTDRAREQVVLMMVRLGGPVRARGSAATAPCVVDGKPCVKMVILGSSSSVPRGRVCDPRPPGDGGRPVGARDDRGYNRVRYTGAVIAIFPFGQLGVYRGSTSK